MNKGKASAATLVPPHLNDIYMKAKEGRSEPEIKKIASILVCALVHGYIGT
jgi:hypothetical protein